MAVSPWVSRQVVHFVGWEDGSILEAASWRLASELCRRHPASTRLLRAHPGGGLSDCLWLLPAVEGPGDVRLNRNGTIQVLERFDGARSVWEPTAWDAYFRSDPREFLGRLEAAAGLVARHGVPAATPRTLTLRVLAAIASTAVKSIAPIEIVPGMIDTSGYGGGPNDKAFAVFPSIPAELLRPRRRPPWHRGVPLLVRVPQRRARHRSRTELRTRLGSPQRRRLETDGHVRGIWAPRARHGTRVAQPRRAVVNRRSSVVVTNIGGASALPSVELKSKEDRC